MNHLTYAMKKLQWLLLSGGILIASFPLVYKPSRILFPQLNNVRCEASNVCLEDINRIDEAKNLLSNAKYQIEFKLGKLSYQPRFIFCSTQKCFQSFGFDQAAAMTLGKSATVVSPRGWKKYYIRHELIHHWQADKIGRVKMLFAPQWLIEGMAYYLSDDPRNLSEPFQSYRQRFKHWYSKIEQDDLVQAIKQEL